MNKPKPAEKKKIRSNFTLEREVYERLKQWSETTGIPMSQIIERLVNEQLTHERLNAIRTAITALELDPITTSDNRHDEKPIEKPLAKEKAIHLLHIVNKVSEDLIAKGVDQKEASIRAIAWARQAYKERRIQL